MRLKRVATLLVSAALASSLPMSAFADGAATDRLESISWANNRQLLVAHEKEAGLAFYLLNTKDSSEKLVIPADQNATEAVAAADGNRIAYVNGNGEVYIVNLQEAKTTKISTDNDPKSELQWSADQNRLFFLKGEKLETIASVSLTTGKNTDILADKVPFKSDLRVSLDGRRFIYTVTPAGTMDAVTLETSSKGTEPQIFSYYTSMGEVPRKISDNLDNKTDSILTGNDSVLYLRTAAKEDAMTHVMNTSTYGGKNRAVFNELMPYQLLSTPDGNSWLLATDANGVRSLHNVLSSGESRLRFAVPEEALRVTLSPDAATAAALVEEGGKTVLRLYSKQGAVTLHPTAH